MLLTLPVREIVSATPRARIVRLDLGGRHFPYRAGQAVLVGIHGDARRRPYSLAGAPEDARGDDCLELLIGVDRGGKSTSLQVNPGARLDVDGPVGQFTLPSNPDEWRLVFIAGGTGIAPLRAMLRQALRAPYRELLLLYSVRTPDEFAYQAELLELANQGRIGLVQTVTGSDGAAGWAGGRGRIGRAQLQPLVQDPSTVCFICGPPPFVNDTKQLLHEFGVAQERIRT